MNLSTRQFVERLIWVTLTRPSCHRDHGQGHRQNRVERARRAPDSREHFGRPGPAAARNGRNRGWRGAHRHARVIAEAAAVVIQTKRLGYSDWSTARPP